jgi:hypothetical protein
LICGLYGTVPNVQALPDEVSVKAAFLFNFAQFVDWPAGGTGSFNFCVIGDDQMAEYLTLNLRNQSIGSRRSVVKSALATGELTSCNIIYVGRSSKKSAPVVMQAVAGKPILLVSEFPELGDRGMAINFFLDEERIRFEVHLGALEKAGLKVSSRLLNVARIAGGK